LSGEPNAGQLQKLLGRLVKKGVKEIKLLDVENKVVASSPPPQSGRKIESTVIKGGQREYNVTAPLVDGTEVLGYIHVTFTLDDLAQANRATLYKRVAVTLLIFSLGILVSLYLAKKYTHPLRGVVEAAKRVAAGDLTKTIEVEGADEIAELTKSFNEMVEKLRQHRELEERLREAERLSTAGKLASGIAHEIRNPLNFISLSIDHIRTRLSGSHVAGSGEVQILMGNIKDELHRLNGMVENFLTVGKPLTLKKTEVDVQTLIRDVVELAQQKAIQQGIEILVEKQEDIPHLHVDPAQVKTCLVNVVLNAIQAMPKGGRLRIGALYRALWDGGPTTPGTIEVTVADTGPGIDQEDLGRIFTPYFTTKKLGIGLGLAITKKIVEEHQGQINVTSRVREGTTVVISFPVEATQVLA
jgi:signal transduction histidine kinase